MDNLFNYKDFKMNEAEVTDDKLKEEIREFAKLSGELTKASAALNKLDKRHKALQAGLVKVIDELKDAEDNILEIDDIIVKIKSKGYKRDNYKWKEAVVWLQSRVNGKMKNLVAEALEANKGFSNIATKLEAQNLEVNEGIDVKATLKAIIDSVKRLSDRLFSKIRSINTELKSDINAFKQKVA